MNVKCNNLLGEMIQSLSHLIQPTNQQNAQVRFTFSAYLASYNLGYISLSSDDSPSN